MHIRASRRLLRSALMALALVSCAQQPVRQTTPAPAVPPHASEAPKTDTPAAASKPKPKPKPVAPKPETKEAAAPDGIERAQVGYYFDTLQGRLRQLAQPGVVVSRNDGHITVDVTSQLQFANGETQLTQSACAALASIRKALAEYRSTVAIAEIGAASADDAALKAARARAASVAKCFVDTGIDARRIESRGVKFNGHQTALLRIEPIVKSP